MSEISEMITFLVVAHEAESRIGIEDWFWPHTDEQKPHLVERQGRCFGLAVDAQTNQEVMGQGDEAQRMMPAQSTAPFAPAHKGKIADEGVLAALLEGRPRPGGWLELCHEGLDGRGLCGRVTQTHLGGRSLQPDWGRRLDFGAIPFVQGRYAITKSGRIATQGINRPTALSEPRRATPIAASAERPAQTA